MTGKVLVTGGAGYLGSILCGRLLESGRSVTVVDNLMYRQRTLLHHCAHPRFDFVFGDVRNESLMRDLLRDVDAVIPMAAVVGATACDRDPWAAQSTNLDAIRLLNRLRSRAQLVVFPTTNSGYGTKSAEAHCTEDSPLEPISLYGRTKVDAEAELLASEGAIALRLATVFGMSPRMRLDLLVNAFVYAACTDKYLVIFEKDFKRNYVHVRDVADGMLYCLEHGDEMGGRPYNLGLEAANLSKEELALKIKEQVPDFFIHYAAIGTDPDKRNYIVSNARLKTAGFEAHRSLDDGIAELIKGYRMFTRGEYANV